MSTQASGRDAAVTSEAQSRRLFVASCIALVATAMTFAVRGDIIGAWGTEFSLDKTSIGWITGMAFWGFALSVIIGGAIVDFLGLKSILVVAFATPLAGLILTIFSCGFLVFFLGGPLLRLCHRGGGGPL